MRRYIIILAGVLSFGLLSAGGCGNSSSSSSQNVNNTMNGAWSFNSGTVTATVNGFSQELAVQNFSVLFESCDIEEDTGSAKFAAIGALQGEYFMLPMLFGSTTASTTRTDLDTWTAETEHGKFTVELLDDNSAKLTGSFNLFGSDADKADVDVVLSKLASTAPTIDINTALNGEWQTQLTVSEDGTINFADGGGYRYHDGNIMPISTTFMNMIFSSTDNRCGHYNSIVCSCRGSS